MPVETTYTALRTKLAGFLDRVTDDREVVVVRRRGSRDVALIDADELSSLMETEYLLRSPKNAERLLEALALSVEMDNEPIPMTSAKASIEELRRSVGLDPLSGPQG